MGAPFARIVARYLIGFALGKAMYYGLLDDQMVAMVTADPELRIIVEGFVVAAGASAVEGWYWLARKFGWAK